MSKQTKRWIQYIVLLLIAVAIAFIIFVTVNKGQVKEVKAGDDAPNFQLKTTEGKKVSLADYKGKGVVLNFWGTWCEPCRREMPALNTAAKTYKAKNIEVLTIHLRDTPQQIDQFFNGLNTEVNLPVLIDKDGEVSKAYGIDPLPTTVIIDKAGKVKAVHKGEMNKNIIDNYMKSIES